MKIYLTPRGKGKRNLARLVVRKFNDYLNSHISEADKQQLTDTLKKINQLTIDYKPEWYYPPVSWRAGCKKFNHTEMLSLIKKDAV